MEKTLTITGLHIIRFGGLAEKIFNFDRGLNVIYGLNGAGKTTLCEFIRFMYYGFEGRSQYDFFPNGEKTAPVCGSMTVDYGGKKLEIVREMGEDDGVLAVTDTLTGLPFDVNGCPGEYFLGIPAALYDRTLYCPQDMSGLVSSGSLDDYEPQLIRAYSGEDNLYGLPGVLQKGMEALQNPQHTGRADLVSHDREVLESRLVAAIIKQNEIMNTESIISSASRQLLETEKKIVIAKADIENLHSLHADESSKKAQQALDRLEKARAEYDALEKPAINDRQLDEMNDLDQKLRDMSDKLEQLESHMSNAKSNLDMHRDMMAEDDYDEMALEEVTEALKKRSQLIRTLALVALPLLVLGIMLSAAVMTLNVSGSGLSMAAGCLFMASLVCGLASAVLALTKPMLYRRLGARSYDEFESICESYRSMSQTAALYRSTYQSEARAYNEKAQEYSALLAELAQKLDKNPDTVTYDELQKELTQINSDFEKAKAAREEYQKAQYEADRLGAAELLTRSKRCHDDLQAKQQQLKQLTEQREALFEKKRALEEKFTTALQDDERPMYIKTRINGLNQALESYQKDCVALSIATEVISDALGVMRFRIKNHLSDGVNHCLSWALREDESFILDDGYCLQYKCGRRLIPVFTDAAAHQSRPAQGLSRSLCELAAVSLRMALVELLETEKAPFVLDEPFAFVDQAGESRFLRRLAAAGMSQTFLFTSHDLPQVSDKYTICRPFES